MPEARHRDDADADDRWLEDRPGAGALSRAEARRDNAVRQWGVVSPSATVIGRAESPEADLSESVRRLHDERHTATEGHSKRAHYLDRLRTTQALCNALDVTPWQRDLALGIMGDIDLTEFGSQRAIPKVALVVLRHVVDVDRRQYFGLDDVDASALSQDRMESLFEEYKAHDVTDEETFQRLAERHGLDVTNLNRLRRVLKEQLREREQLDDDIGRALGRNPHRDPNLPSFEDRDVPAEASD
ncbi:DNA-directed RNA polymerase subunit epsilon [Halobacterium zhouii]|uniref:DNA-directed RNA polymerase subunit epsilon n=1 Tax=Halobacterium zhouii TaxID=2902624 RepID=UPI001E64AC0F|nr:DNA-directed RNA polymerase subunit epsilon [Halobacterium zhouii]